MVRSHITGTTGHPAMRERDLERYLIRCVKTMGGACYKFVSPGNAGVPDRIILLPNRDIRFLELKSRFQKPSKLQEFHLQRLRSFGFIANWANSKEAIDEFLS